MYPPRPYPRLACLAYCALVCAWDVLKLLQAVCLRALCRGCMSVLPSPLPAARVLCSMRSRVCACGVLKPVKLVLCRLFACVCFAEAAWRVLSALLTAACVLRSLRLRMCACDVPKPLKLSQAARLHELC